MAAKFKPSHVDVLIIGAGPAGSMLSTYLSRTGIHTRIIDKRNAGIITGQADGVNGRSMELMDGLGLAAEIQKDSGTPRSMATWGPDGAGGIERNPGIDPGDVSLKFDQGDYQIHTQSQGRIERILQRSAGEFADVEVERSVLPVDLEIDRAKAEEDEGYPVKVVVQHLRDEEASVAQMKAFVKGQDLPPSDGLFRSNIGPANHSEDLIKKVAGRKETEETIYAKYVVGCDGAWSRTRRQLGIDMVGSKTDAIWGVLDIIPLTDFPDARDFGMIQSDAGSIMMIPREYGLVRLYTQLSDVKPGEDGAVDRSKITPDTILQQAKKIFHPYKIDYRYCDWWTAYQTGQRVGESYNDPTHRVFLAGDAVHTHSPKEGLGMNTSMQDALNLGFKLAAVINKQSPRRILQTYQSERRPIAQQLIDGDREVSAAISSKNVPPGDLANIWFKQAQFMTGLAIQYPRSDLVCSLGSRELHAEGLSRVNGETSFSPLAKSLIIGQRIPPVRITQHTGRVQFSLLQKAPLDGRWRLFVFAGDVRAASQMTRVNALGEALRDPHTGLLKLKHKLQMSKKVPFPWAVGSDIGAKIQPKEREVPLIDIITVHASQWRETELSEFDDVFWPWDDTFGRAYDKIHCATDAYEELGIDHGVGCLALVRPDQYLAYVGALEDVDGLRTFASGCLII